MMKHEPMDNATMRENAYTCNTQSNLCFLIRLNRGMLKVKKKLYINYRLFYKISSTVFLSKHTLKAADCFVFVEITQLILMLNR